MNALTPAQLIEMLRVYRQTYADSVIAFAAGKPDRDVKVAECAQAEQAILKAVFPETFGGAA